MDPKNAPSSAPPYPVNMPNPSTYEREREQEHGESPPIYSQQQSQNEMQLQHQPSQVSQAEMRGTPAPTTAAVPAGGQAPDGGPQYLNATPLSALTSQPQPVDCPNCRKRVLTRTAFRTGNMTHVWALVLCWFTLICTPVPYFVNSTKNVTHSCSNCGIVLATYHRSGSTEIHAHATVAGAPPASGSLAQHHPGSSPAVGEKH